MAHKENEIGPHNSVMWCGKLTNAKKENIEEYYKRNYPDIKRRIEENEKEQIWRLKQRIIEDEKTN